MRTTFLILLLATGTLVQAQKSITDSDLALLREYQADLRAIGDSMVGSPDWDMREQAAIVMVKKMVQALQVPNSFQFPFDSVPSISVVYPEDRSFRIITWQVQMKDRSHRYFGTLQMNETSLNMYPLIDMSLFMEDPDHTVAEPDNWYGQIYYDVQAFRHKKEDYYLLFGWDGNDMWSNRKIVEVLWFDNGQPKFGKPVFNLSEGEIRTRIMIEYKEDASPALVWDHDLDMIVFDYLRPENPMSEGIYMTYIPDGTYQGFSYDKKSKLWKIERVVFNETLESAPFNPPNHKGEDPNIYIRN